MEAPTIFTPPKRKLTCKTTHGFECIDFARDVLGIELHPWQKWVLKHALELNPDGTYRFRTVVLLVGRQNGKSTLLQVWALWRMYVDGAPLTIGTAQNLDIAEEQWQSAVDLAEGNEYLAAEIEAVKKTNGKYSLELSASEELPQRRYKVAAATRKGGRGLSGDLVIMDELREHSNYESWSAVTKTTMSRTRAQVLCASNAGDASSVVLRDLRTKAIDAINSGDTSEERLGLFEYSAMRWNPTGGNDRSGEWENLPTSDRQGWAMANPSLNWGVGETALTDGALEAAYRTDPDPVYRTECLCQWVNTTQGGAFEDGVWEGLRDADSRIIGGYWYGIDVAWDRSSATIVAAGRREDLLLHGEVVAPALTLDRALEWFTLPDAAGNFVQRVDDPQLQGIVLQENGAPVSSLVDDLRKLRRWKGTPQEEPVRVLGWAGGELGRGTAQFYDAVRHGQLRHLGQPILDVAVSMALTRPIADYWIWDRKKSLVDIAPLVAMTAAVWALQQPEEERQESAYSNPDLMFV